MKLWPTDWEVWTWEEDKYGMQDGSLGPRPNQSQHGIVVLVITTTTTKMRW